MKRNVFIWSLWGLAVTSLLGTLLHFLYEWLGEALWIAPFSGVNESTWEHMKLLFWPMLLFTVFQSFFFRDYASFPCVKARSMLIGLLLIPVLFYTYNGVIGRSPAWLNIAIFYLSAATAYLYEARQLLQKESICKHPKRSLALLCAVALLFVIFTFRTPTLAIFKDPLTGLYGR